MPGYFDTVRDEIAPLLPKSASLVMDVGCGDGATSRWLKTVLPGVVTVGVEIDPRAARTAAEVLDELVVADLDGGLQALDAFAGRVDVLLLLDVLEHLRDPWDRLANFSRLLSPNGVVVASVPNVRNLKVLLPLLLKGEWSYRDAGILDRSHLRFFTRGSAVALFESAGFVVERVMATGPLRPARVRSLRGLLAMSANRLLFGALEPFVAHQYVLRAASRAGRPRRGGGDGAPGRGEESAKD